MKLHLNRTATTNDAQTSLGFESNIVKCRGLETKSQCDDGPLLRGDGFFRRVLDSLPSNRSLGKVI